MSPSPRLQLVLVDDHPAIRRGLRHLLAACSDMAVVGEAADGESALRTVQSLAPDVVLLDVHLLNSSGYEVAARIRAAMPLVRIIMLSSFDGTDQAGQAFASGAHAWLLKPGSGLPSSGRSPSGRSFSTIGTRWQSSLRCWR